MYKVLTIAGSDPCGGAGIQADLKTFFARGVYGLSAVTAVTAQNTVSLDGVFPLPAEFVKLQISSVMSDIGADVWKTGMLVNKKIVETVVEEAARYKIKQLVVDPVMVSKTVGRLLEKEALKSLVKKLLPLAAIVTPNIDEAKELTGLKITNVNEMKKAAVILHKMGAKNVLIKGGHLEKIHPSSLIIHHSIVIDILFDGKRFHEFTAPKINTQNTHGTGCTLASCIAAELAKGKNIKEAVGTAKNYVNVAIKKGQTLKIGKGHGPIIHGKF